MKLQKLILAITMGLFCYSTSFAQQTDSNKVIKKSEYTCSMHPEVISNTLGYCPKCGMKLIEKEIQSKPEKVVDKYTCSMHPEIISDKPGNCPKCGMALIIKTDGSNNHMECMGKMDGEKAHPKRMMYVGGGILMVAMMTVMIMFAFR